ANGATLQIATIALFQARSQLGKVERAETNSARAAEAAKARKLLQDAGEQLQKSEKLFEAQIAKYADPKTDQEKKDKRDLELAKLQAQYERAVSLFEVSRTYPDDGKKENEDARAAAVKAAEAELKQVAGAELPGPLPSQARVWLMRCLYEKGDP